MSGIDKRHFGLELAASVPIYEGLALKGALSWGQYTYNSNPDYIQLQDNSGEIKNQGKVYWKTNVWKVLRNWLPILDCPTVVVTISSSHWMETSMTICISL